MGEQKEPFLDFRVATDVSLITAATALEAGLDLSGLQGSLSQIEHRVHYSRAQCEAGGKAAPMHRLSALASPTSFLATLAPGAGCPAPSLLVQRAVFRVCGGLS